MEEKSESRMASMQNSARQEFDNKPAEKLFHLYVIKPEKVQELWDAKDPNQQAQQLLLDHIEELGESVGQNLLTWDENESRFEPNELKWIGDFIINNLIFIKRELNVDQPEAIAHLLQVFWQTLDLFGEQAELEVGLLNRYEKLQNELKRCFSQKIVTKEQVGKILDFCRKSIFGHLQLYLACMGQKKQAQRTKKVQIFQEVPQTVAMPDLETDCVEINQERVLTPEEIALQQQMEEGMESAMEMDEEEEIIDPDDPLYGLDHRLAELNIAEESKRIIREKLMHANNKIKQGLEARQADLDAKVQAQPQATGKKR